ncbi:hypothetical protein IQ235_06020 [Oscillatoriales cyanobacterium LEGE 11467]|uniref:Uncharacterized protein n=1 Tax=Zarconia navalis LEGE 11467 TaxID=1828826 RepID=A0A928VY96_9CYAN|nr:hypothetical protein [Zarconia navalis]MBE9040348.1 hypothetical protein [Zarconia navalis LEGE 11467]
MIPIYPIALVLTAISIWWFGRTSEDIYSVLAAGSAIVSFIIGFAWSPWQVQVAIVLGVLSLEQFYKLGIREDVRMR